jgi:HEAT repeat protein
LVQAGARADCVLPTARLSLLDTAPSVRAHSAIILASLLDRDSVPALAECLHDEKPLVSSAAARAVAHIGTQVPEERGNAARALVDAWVTSSDPQKTQLYRAMVGLAGLNYGNDEEEWRRWAARLP